MSHFRPLTTALVLLFATVLPVGAQSSFPAPDPSADAGQKAMATYLVEDSVGDVQLGQLGIRKAHAAAVRALARAMVRDHTKTAQAGMAVAQRLGAEDVTYKSDSSNQIDLSHLARYSGAEFDRAYLKTLADAHKSDISLIRDALEFTTDAGLRAALTSALAIDRMHLRMATAAQSAAAG